MDVPNHCIIQTFGTAHPATLKLLDSDGVDILDGVYNTSESGYDRNSFLFYGGDDDYSLSIHTSTSAPIRISITVVDTSYGLSRYNCFEDIPLATTMSVDIRISTAATVFRYAPTQARSHTIISAGHENMRVYLIDPSTNQCYSLMALIGESEIETPRLQRNKTYYVVMYLPYENDGGDIPGDTTPSPEVETISVTIS